MDCQTHVFGSALSYLLDIEHCVWEYISLVPWIVRQAGWLFSEGNLWNRLGSGTPGQGTIRGSVHRGRKGTGVAVIDRKMDVTLSEQCSQTGETLEPWRWLVVAVALGFVTDTVGWSSVIFQRRSWWCCSISVSIYCVVVLVSLISVLLLSVDLILVARNTLFCVVVCHKVALFHYLKPIQNEFEFRNELLKCL